MPFNKPWRTYCAGDFFYGFSGARARLIIQLTRRKMDQFNKKNTVAWLDQLLTGTAIHDTQCLNHDFAEYCRKNIKYKCVVMANEDKEVPAEQGQDSDNNKRWRRKSKAGIEFLVKHHHFIHFAIDFKMDWNDVIAKPTTKAVPANLPFDNKETLQYKVVDPDMKYRVITYAEIRFIYRNRKNLDFIKRIQFWYQDNSGVNSSFTPDVPPWDKYPEIWSKYIPQSEKG